ncbi:ATP-grasp domain-containing protein [Streptococcus cuniculipharyngis]|uniref:ATP-grasp domain-containing protein n=1 Tax=Streptococcus cuniculipharyngis TaxID=1562651 RepID=A0A5C5SAI6_9STRE|nr:ATP-grasp domain-containing protein [Streptococcus cuniculipharyngis]TWS96263.1 ATP-grasp domain-containing protein [Streptococcus cuniculipharyngis]
MNYVLISPYYPQNFQRFSIELAKQGITVLGIGQEPYEQLDQPLKEALTEYFRVDDLENLDEVKRAVAFLFYKHGPIDRIESHNEYWLELDAALRDQFNVFGPKTEELTKTKFKSQMKAYFKKAAVPVVPGQVVKQKTEVAKAVKTLGLPLIAKPDNGVGAAATYKLTHQADVETFVQDWDESTAYFLEKFVSSDKVCTYDGLVDAEGKVVFATSLIYKEPPMVTLKNKSDFTYYITKEVEPKLAAYGQKIVEAFGMKERFFHIEFFCDKDDYVAIEYNNRPAGAFALDVYNFAHSINLFEQYARLVAGHGFEPSAYASQYSLAVTRRDYRHYHFSEEEILTRYSQELKAKLRMPAAFAALQGDSFYVLNSDTEEDILDMMEAIQRLAQD